MGWSKKTSQTPRRNVRFYRNELDVLDPAAVTWNPYTQDVLEGLPAICTAARYLWTARLPLICTTRCAHHLPDRVMRQFAMAQHIPENASVYTDEYHVGEIANAMEIWNERHLFTQFEREPITPLETYMRWYWHITRRYVLQAPVQAVAHHPYTPRAPLERNVVSIPNSVKLIIFSKKGK